MHFLIRTASVALMLSLLGETAAAQQGPWVDPSGRYSLEFDQVTWEQVPHGANEYLEIESVNARVRDRYLTCSAQRFGPLPSTIHLDQAQANVGSERFGAENLQRAVPNATDRRVLHNTIDGVAVVDLFFVDQGIHQRWRTFFLATPEGVVQHQIRCGGVEPVFAEDYAEIDAVLQTMRFLPTN